MKSIYHEKIIERIVNNIDNQQFNDFTELFDYIMLNRYLSEYYKNNTEKSEHYKDTCKNSIEYLINNLKKFLNTHIPQVIIKIGNDSFNFLGFYV